MASWRPTSCPNPVGGILAGLLLLGACTPPDHPPHLPLPVPEEARAFLHPEEIRVRSLGPGVQYQYLWTREHPWATHLLRVDLARCDLALDVLQGSGAQGEPFGRARVTELLEAGGEGIVAGVNGDFFTPEGLPLGTEVLGGEVRRVRDRPALAWRPGAPPWMGVPMESGDSALVVGWWIPRGAPDGVTEVVGGFPLLLGDGRRVGDLAVSERASFAAARHPRTAVGYDPREEALWVVVVDGRQPGYSDGMTLPELASLLEGLGATEAVNLDGGGSSIMVLKGLPVSRPSDAEGERPVANALALRRRPELCRPRMLPPPPA